MAKKQFQQQANKLNFNFVYAGKGKKTKKKTPIVTRDAAMTPVQAANIVEITIVAKANPPLIGPNKPCRLSYSFSVTPQLSKIKPIKMKRGIAGSTWLFISP